MVRVQEMEERERDVGKLPVGPGDGLESEMARKCMYTYKTVTIAELQVARRRAKSIVIVCLQNEMEMREIERDEKLTDDWE